MTSEALPLSTAAPLEASTSRNDHERRQELGDAYLSGRGYEIGAGAWPSRYAGTELAAVIDIRSKPELEILHASDLKMRGMDGIPYEVLSLQDALASNDQRDFLVAHQTFEHLGNPIKTLIQWLGLVRPGGRIFFGVPSADNPCERDRLPTPLSHVLEDYLFDRPLSSYESAQHVPTFLLQWSKMNIGQWFDHYPGHQYAAVVLGEMGRTDPPHDLHWHTYSLDCMTKIIESALYFAGYSARWLHREIVHGALYVVFEKAEPSSAPSYILAYADQLRHAANAIEHPTIVMPKMVEI